MRIPVLLRTSTIPHVQNACSSSKVRSRRFPVRGQQPRPCRPLCHAGDHTGQRLPGRGERLFVPGLASGLQQLPSRRALLADGLDQDRQDRQALTGAGVHP